MPNNLTPKELARVFAMYAFCEGIKILHPDNSTSSVIGIIGDQLRIVHDDTGSAGCCLLNGDCKLLLRPLSSITDEDAIAIGEIIDEKEMYYVDGNVRVIFLVKKFIRQVYENSNPKYPERVLSIHQYLISKGYAVPIYFSPNHPLNNKTPLELNLSIPIT